MMKQDFDGAEKNMRKGLDLGMPMKEAEGASLLQMGMLAMQKNDIRKAEGLIRQALSKGLPDKENQAAAYLQLCSIMMTKREFRAAKEFFRKAKNLKTDDLTDRGSDQTDREVYFPDPGLRRNVSPAHPRFHQLLQQGKRIISFFQEIKCSIAFEVFPAMNVLLT